jgi:hypothetical protein
LYAADIQDLTLADSLVDKKTMYIIPVEWIPYIAACDQHFVLLPFKFCCREVLLRTSTQMVQCQSLVLETQYLVDVRDGFWWQFGISTTAWSVAYVACPRITRQELIALLEVLMPSWSRAFCILVQLIPLECKEMILFLAYCESFPIPLYRRVNTKCESNAD